MIYLFFILIFSAAFCTALLGGSFFAFSAFFMRAIGGLSAERGIVAMQATLVAIRKPAFLVLFFGTALLCLALGGLALFYWRDAHARYALAGACVFLIGGFAVTMLAHMPLNRALLRASPDESATQENWRALRLLWLRWNHVRMIATLLACACFMLALAELGISPG